MFSHLLARFLVKPLLILVLGVMLILEVSTSLLAVGVRGWELAPLSRGVGVEGAAFSFLDVSEGGYLN